MAHAPHLGNTVQLALVVEVDASPHNEVWKQKNQSRPLLIAASGELNAGELTLVVRLGDSWWTDQFSNHPGPEPGFELAYPNIHQSMMYRSTESSKISRTQDNRISETSPGDDPVLVVQQKPNDLAINTCK